MPPLTVSDLPPAARAWLCQFLDFRALMRLRRVSHGCLRLVHEELFESLRVLVQTFVRNADELVDVLTRLDGYIGGDVALLFFLRTSHFHANSLELYVPPTAYDILRDYLRIRQGAIERPPPTFSDHVEYVWNTRAVEQYTDFRTPSNHTVRLFQSVTHDALAPITRGWATHTINYVNATYFGCAHPSLLFSYRAWLSVEGDDEFALLREAETRGFDVRFCPSQWPDLGVGLCGAARGLCPSQVRRFSERHAIAARMRPTADQPLATRLRWRTSEVPCGGPCLADSRPQGLAPWQLYQC
ncbi:hypothetical protein C8Q76DRAFT_803435 [Earliella scabrosa]|nr:hypothetical protein C8Q76DRAFT_803435 [Earliella scabrosa]